MSDSFDTCAFYGSGNPFFREKFVFLYEKSERMESRDLPRIGLLDVDKASAEALGPVIHLDKNGFFYCMQGCLKLALDGRVFELRSGDMYIYPPFSQTYIGEMSDDLRGVIGMADFDFVLSALDPVANTGSHIYVRENPCISLDGEQCRRIEDLIEAVRRREGDEAGIVQMQLLPTLGKALCYEILAAYFANYPLQPLKQDRKDKIFHNFLFALHQHFRTHRDVAYYAGLQCLTPRYFTTIVRETSGRTALQWITMSVVAEAKKQLSDPNRSAKEIADSLGFSNQSFFGSYFKQYEGVSPTEFRATRHAG